MATNEVIYSALCSAVSQNPDQLRVGEATLKQWETQRGYYAALSTIFADRSVEGAVRWMAITCLKNGIDCYWRPNAPHAISDEEKAIVRSALLNCLEEPVQQVLVQLAVLIARIGRLDCPTRWPELLPTLAQGVCGQSALMQKCCLFTLKEVSKMFASRRLPAQRLVFFEITGDLFTYISDLWKSHRGQYREALLRGDIALASDYIMLLRTCLKILRVMVIDGFRQFNTHQEAMQHVNNLLEDVPVCLQQTHQFSQQLGALHTATSENCLRLMKKTTVHMIKTIHKLQQSHPIGFVTFISASLELVYSTVFNQEQRNLLYQDYVVYCLHLMKGIVECEEYMIPHSLHISDVTPPPQVLEAQQAKMSFFSAQRLNDITEQLITHYMVLSAEELKLWEECPEEYAAPEDSVGQLYQFSLRGSTERVFMVIFREFQQSLVPLLLSMLQAVQNTNSSSDSHSLLMKEAVYLAAGLGAFDLYEHLDYDQWYSSHLVHELSISSPNYRVVRRRIVWLMGCWVNVKMDPALRPSLYRLLIPLLHPREDLVVRLTCAESLRLCVDDVCFTAEDFSPFLPEAMQLLLQLLKDVKESDTMLSVMKVFSQLIEQVGSAIRPHIGALLDQLPRVWAEASGDSMSLLCCAIVVTLTHTVSSLGEVSIQLHPFLIPVISTATDVKLAEHVYLAEDGLDLWLAVLHQTPSASDDLLRLMQHMVGLLGLAPPTDSSSHSMTGLMDIGSDSLRSCFSIIEAYVVLCATSPDLFAQYCADITTTACECYLKDVKPEGILAIVQVMDRLVVSYPQLFHKYLQSCLVSILHSIMSGSEDSTPVVSVFLALLARVLIQSPAYFLSLMELVGNQVQPPLSASVLLGTIIDAWSDKLDNITRLHERKLCGLVAASLLTTADPCVTTRFDGLLEMCVEVLHDVTDLTAEGRYHDTMTSQTGTAYTEADTNSQHAARMKQLSVTDPVHSISLPQLVTEKLQQCTAVHSNGYTELVISVDIAVREQLLEFLPPELGPTLLAITT